jgi:hypothetical protein
MIKEFEFCTKDGLFFEPNITGNIGDNLFANINYESYKRYNNSMETGVAWINQDNKIIFLEEGIRIFGLPTPDMEKAVLIYPREHSKFRFPCNSVVYNSDGTFHLQLREPVLISKAYRERTKYMNYKTADWLWYDHVLWRKDVGGNIALVVRIGFDRDWYEERVLNVETGHLGELIGSGKF